MSIKEYTILCIYNGGKPFYLSTYSSFNEAMLKLYDIIDLEKQRNRAYYVDNDFFENIFPPNLQNLKYFSIKEREVSDWVKYSENKKKKNNIIYFNKKLDIS